MASSFWNKCLHFAVNYLPIASVFPLSPLSCFSGHLLSDKMTILFFFFNFSCRQSNSPPPIRRQPTWSRSSLVCIKSSVIKWSDCWGWSVLLLLIGEGACLGHRDQVRSDENTEEHQSPEQVWWRSMSHLCSIMEHPWPSLLQVWLKVHR